jgi:hypothetical protein
VPAATVLLCAVAAALAQVPSSRHVVLVIDENTTYNELVANMSWLTGQGNGIVIRAWDTSGNYGDKQIRVSIP